MLFFVFSLVIDAEAQKRRRNRYGYKRSKSKKFSKYSGGKVGYSGVGNPKYTTVGASINGTYYFGDISNSSSKFSTEYKFVPDGFGLTYTKVLHPGIHGRVAFNWLNIKADDFETGKYNSEDPSEKGRWDRNYHFKNSIYELSAGFEIDMIPSNSGARGRFPINPYMFVGVAGFFHAPKAKAPEYDQAGNPTGKAGQWVDLQSLGTEGQHSDSLNLKPYSKFQFAIPLGLGVKVKLTSRLDLNVELGFRYLFTDYLDDIGGNYASLDAFGGNHLARALSERGAEQTAMMSGSSRLDGNGNPLYSVGTTNVELDTSNPDVMWDPGASGAYTHGQNYLVGGNRGSSANDFYVATQIRLVYILDKKGMSKGKFR